MSDVAQLIQLLQVTLQFSLHSQQCLRTQLRRSTASVSSVKVGEQRLSQLETKLDQSEKEVSKLTAANVQLVSELARANEKATFLETQVSQLQQQLQHQAATAANSRAAGHEHPHHRCRKHRTHSHRHTDPTEAEAHGDGDDSSAIHRGRYVDWPSFAQLMIQNAQHQFQVSQLQQQQQPPLSQPQAIPTKQHEQPTVVTTITGGRGHMLLPSTGTADVEPIPIHHEDAPLPVSRGVAGPSTTAPPLATVVPPPPSISPGEIDSKIDRKLSELSRTNDQQLHKLAVHCDDTQQSLRKFSHDVYSKLEVFSTNVADALDEVKHDLKRSESRTKRIVADTVQNVLQLQQAAAIGVSNAAGGGGSSSSGATRLLPPNPSPTAAAGAGGDGGRFGTTTATTTAPPAAAWSKSSTPMSTPYPYPQRSSAQVSQRESPRGPPPPPPHLATTAETQRPQQSSSGGRPPTPTTAPAAPGIGGPPISGRAPVDFDDRPAVSSQQQKVVLSEGALDNDDSAFGDHVTSINLSQHQQATAKRTGVAALDVSSFHVADTSGAQRHETRSAVGSNTPVTNVPISASGVPLPKSSNVSVISDSMGGGGPPRKESELAKARRELEALLAEEAAAESAKAASGSVAPSLAGTPSAPHPHHHNHNQTMSSYQNMSGNNNISAVGSQGGGGGGDPMIPQRYADSMHHRSASSSDSSPFQQPPPPALDNMDFVAGAPEVTSAGGPTTHTADAQHRALQKQLAAEAKAAIASRGRKPDLD